MMAPKTILILLVLFSCALLTQSSVKIGVATKTNTRHLQRNRTEKDVGNSIAKKQEVFVPSSRELYDDYGRRYDYPVSQLPLFRAHYLEREPIPIQRQFPFSSSIVVRNDEEPREEYIPRRRFGYDGGLESTTDEHTNRFFDAQDFGNTFERTENFMFQDQERQRPALEDIPSRLPFEPEVTRPIEEPADTRVSPVSPKSYPQDMSYAELLRARPVVDVEDYPQRLSSQDDPGLWQQEAIDLRAKAEALKAHKYLKHLIEEVGPTVTLKQVLDKYGPKVASLFSDLQRATGARFPNPINETNVTPKALKTKQSKSQKLLSPSHHDGSKDAQNKTGRAAANLTKSNRKTLELASEVTKEAKDFIKIFKWFNEYYKSLEHNTTKVDSDIDNSDKGDNVGDMRKKKVRIMKITKNTPGGNNEDDIRKKKIRIEKLRKNEHQVKERTWDYEKIENILNSL